MSKSAISLYFLCELSYKYSSTANMDAYALQILKKCVMLPWIPIPFCEFCFSSKSQGIRIKARKKLGKVFENSKFFKKYQNYCKFQTFRILRGFRVSAKSGKSGNSQGVLFFLQESGKRQGIKIKSQENIFENRNYRKSIKISIIFKNVWF